MRANTVCWAAYDAPIAGDQQAVVGIGDLGDVRSSAVDAVAAPGGIRCSRHDEVILGCRVQRLRDDVVMHQRGEPDTRDAGGDRERCGEGAQRLGDDEIGDAVEALSPLPRLRRPNAPDRRLRHPSTTA
jgi:hypothetical protein